MEIVKHPSWWILACYFLEHDWKKVIDTVPRSLLRKCARCGLEIDERDDFDKHCKRELGEN